MYCTDGWKGEKLNWKKRGTENHWSYPDAPVLIPDYGNGVVVDLNIHKANVGHVSVATVIILGCDVEGWETGIWATGLGNGIGAGAHEIIVMSIKGLVVGITPGPASCCGCGHALRAIAGHLTGLHLPARCSAAGGDWSHCGEGDKRRKQVSGQGNGLFKEEWSTEVCRWE